MKHRWEETLGQTFCTYGCYVNVDTDPSLYFSLQEVIMSSRDGRREGRMKGVRKEEERKEIITSILLLCFMEHFYLRVFKIPFVSGVVKENTRVCE